MTSRTDIWSFQFVIILLNAEVIFILVLVCKTSFLRYRSVAGMGFLESTNKCLSMNLILGYTLGIYAIVEDVSMSLTTFLSWIHQSYQKCHFMSKKCVLNSLKSSQSNSISSNPLYSIRFFLLLYPYLLSLWLDDLHDIESRKYFSFLA